MIRILFFVILLLINSLVKGQTYNKIALLKNGFKTQDLIIKKDILKSDKKKSEHYLAIEYDFDDSISVFKGEKLIASHKLNYVLPDSDLAIFPNNRMLIKLRKIADSNKAEVYTMVFWKSRLFVEFKINKDIPYYSFWVDKKSKYWTLLLLNTFPWP
jgi:hypothetical protein